MTQHTPGQCAIRKAMASPKKARPIGPSPPTLTNPEVLGIAWTITNEADALIAAAPDHPAKMAATNKCLAQNNKSRHVSSATNCTNGLAVAHCARAARLQLPSPR